MGFAKTEREWAERAARHLKAELKRADVTYEELASRLKKHGFNPVFNETEGAHTWIVWREYLREFAPQLF